jgi:hypothetical protein
MKRGIEALTEQEVEAIKEKIKSGTSEKEIYLMLGCQNNVTIYAVSNTYCGNCQFLYKSDIRAPGRFGCEVEGFIRAAKMQIANESKS